MIAQFFRALFSKNFPCNPRNEELSHAELRAISVGAVLAGVRAEYWDSLKTGAGGNAGKSLKEWWGIYSPQSSVKALVRLRNRMHSKMYNYVLDSLGRNLEQELPFEAFCDVYQEHWLGLSDDEYDKHDEYDTYLSSGYNLTQTIDELIKREIVHSDERLESIDTTAWDMGRMVNVARWCYEIGYIPESLAWEYIFQAEKVCADIYADWANFGKSYIVGRAMWGGVGMQLTNTIDMVERLHKDDKSPWRHMSLR